MANVQSNKAVVDQHRQSYADDAKARRVHLVDSSGNVNSADNPLFNLPSDFGLEVMRGNVSTLSLVHKFGRNTDIDSAAIEDVWDGGGVWVAPTQARLHNLVSSQAADAGTVLSSGTSTGGSATTLVDTGATFQTDGVAVGDVLLNDTNIAHGIIRTVDSETQVTVWRMESTSNAASETYRIVTPASTGAAVVRIFGLDENYALTEEHVVLNGTNNVATTTTFVIIYRMLIVLAGSGASNAGNITATAQTDATVTAQISIGNNQTLMAIYQIPAGKIGYLVRYYASANKGVGATAVVDIRLMAQPIGEVFQLKHIQGLSTSASSILDHLFKFPLNSSAFAARSIVKMEAAVSADNVDLSAGFDIILVDE